MHKTTRIFLTLFLVVAMMIAALSSCKSVDTPESKPTTTSTTDSADNESKTTDVGSSESITSADNTDASTDSSTTATRTKSVTKATSTKSTKSKKVTLYVKNFGAKGDGVTDDAEAIFKAINALRSSPAGSVLEFEKGKTYYYEDNGTMLGYLFYFSGDKDLTVKGNGCLVKMGGYHTTYLKMDNCENVTIDGFNLDYAIKPAFAAELLSIDPGTGVALVKADRSITLEDGEVFEPSRTIFGTVPTPSSRRYFWVSKYEMVDNKTRTVRVYFDTTKGNTECYSDTTLIKQYGLVLPMPHNGFAEADSNTGISFNIQYCNDLTFSNLNVYSNKYQTFAPRECGGTILFDNVNFKRAPYDQDLIFSSWGDIYHPIHCRAKLIWKNCSNEHPYDDVFNIVGVTMYVSAKQSSAEITLTAVDKWYHVPRVKAGDTISIIDTTTGKFIGRTTVRKVIKQDTDDVSLLLNHSLSGLKTGSTILAWDESAVCDPASEMINCTMDGTFRARTNMTFTNCKFHIRRFWIGLEAPQEGPLPSNLLFRGCDLTGDSGKVWNLSSGNRLNEKGYHIENIVFENCKGISMDKVDKDPYDQLTIR